MYTGCSKKVWIPDLLERMTFLKVSYIAILNTKKLLYTFLILLNHFTYYFKRSIYYIVCNKLLCTLEIKIMEH